MVTPEEYIEAKTGLKGINVTYEVDSTWHEVDLSEMLTEFLELNSKGKKVQLKRPIHNDYIVINKSKAVIIATLDNKLPRIEMKKPKQIAK